MALALSYDSGTDTLTITGGTSGSPYTWEDVWDYDNGTVSSGNDGTGTIDGTKPITDVMDKPVAGVYQIKSNIEFGDGSTATYFKSNFETVRFDDGKTFSVYDSTNLQLGEKDGSSADEYYGRQGSKWSLAPTASSDLIPSTEADAVCNMYASVLELRKPNPVRFQGGTVEMRDCIISGNYSVIGGSSYLGFQNSADYSLYNCQFTDVAILGMFRAPSAFEGITVCGSSYGVHTSVDMTADSPVLLDNTRHARQDGSAKTLNIVNPNINLTAAKLYINDDDGVIKEQYTCNIKVVDETGSAVEGATVTCTDKNGSEVFSVTTAADGTITEQTITYKQWQGPSETPTAYSPHKFVISKDRFSEEVIADVTVDGLTDWLVQLSNLRNQVRSSASNPARLSVIR